MPVILAKKTGFCFGVKRAVEMAEKALKEGRLTVEERRAIMDAYEAGLQGYTYFEQ